MTRRAAKLLLLAAVAVGGTVLTAAPASAYCDPVFSELTGRCDNGCTVTAAAYAAADAGTDDALPDVEFICPA